MPTREQSPAVEDIDRDSALLRLALARLAGVLAGELSAVAVDLHQHAACTPWQACALAEQLGRLQRDAAAVRREVGKLVLRSVSE